MKELNVVEVKDVNGGVVALYWVGVGAYHGARYAASWAARHPRETLAAVGAVGAFLSEL
jgi:hypothetical protein